MHSLLLFNRAVFPSLDSAIKLLVSVLSQLVLRGGKSLLSSIAVCLTALIRRLKYKKTLDDWTTCS